MRGAAIPERLVPRARPGRAERGRGPPRGPGHATRPPPRRRRGSLVTRGCSNKLTFQYATITSAWCSVSLFHRSDPALTGSSRRTSEGRAAARHIPPRSAAAAVRSRPLRRHVLMPHLSTRPAEHSMHLRSRTHAGLGALSADLSAAPYPAVLRAGIHSSALRTRHHARS